MIEVVHFVFRFFFQKGQRIVFSSYKIECGVFNVDLDEHNKLSMKGSYFVQIDRFFEFSRALVVSVIMSVFLERLTNLNRTHSRAPSARVWNKFPSPGSFYGSPVRPAWYANLLEWAWMLNGEVGVNNDNSNDNLFQYSHMAWAHGSQKPHTDI